VNKNKEKKEKKGCEICGNRRGVIYKYNLCICRRCFREVAETIGFQKYS